MKYIKLIVASVLLASMSACVADNESDIEGYIKTINIVGPDKITFEQISGSEQTKATSVENGSALVFNWAAGDTLGIFPNKGNQVEFPITTQESSTSASFDGGGWALRNNASYAAYYPFSVWNYHLNNKTIVLDYSGQVQNGNGSFEHLSAYDYLASAKTTPENNMVTFHMDRQGSILYIDIVVPEPATINSLTISCDEAIFVEKAALDISGNNPVVTPVETKESLTLSFENTATTEQNETVRAYMAVQPVDFSSKIVTATLRTGAGTYTAPVVSRVVNKGKAAFLRFSDSFTNGTPGAVDLGLPSGLKWASFNLGASAPEEYGDYFAWGDPEPNYTSQDPLTWRGNKTGYNWASYKWCNGSYFTLTKYNYSSSYGTVDNKYVLDPEDDAATANWGGNWRMPTDAEWTELRTECTWTWTTQNGVNGRLVIGPNGNSIFLPAAGYRNGTNLYGAGSNGEYWSSSISTGYPNYAWYVGFGSGGVSRGGQNRDLGIPVRPVARVDVIGVSLNKSNIDLIEGGTESLSATVTPSNAVIWSSSNTDVATVDYTGVVTAVAPGTATITATTYDGGLTATCTVTVNPHDLTPTETMNGYGYVDLGLPSGLKWASCNVGANVPEKYGYNFAWGETSPKRDYSWSTYIWCNGSSNTQTKYCIRIPYGFHGSNETYGTIDNKTVLEPEDDAASFHWGGTWRMPTTGEWQELIKECTNTWTTQNGVYGRLFTSKTNGNSIFLPATGYWSSSLYTDRPYYAYGMFIRSDTVNYRDKEYRYYGQSVRPVTDEGVRVSVTNLSLNKNSLNLAVGGILFLTATVTPSTATQPTVIWSSSNNSVATVDYNGGVTAISVGSATITATTYDGGLTATCDVAVSEPISGLINGHRWVDLGLPSGLKWASDNVDGGNYFAWGETEPYYEAGYAQSSSPVWKSGKSAGYNWESYRFSPVNDYFSKYVTSSSYGRVDNKTVLEPEDDAASVKWGSSWRMPTDAEWEELINECTLIWDESGGSYWWYGGMLVVSNTNGNHIFLPCDGAWVDTKFDTFGYRGVYWSSSLDTDNPSRARSASFSESAEIYRGRVNRCYGLSIRAVAE